MTIIYVLVIVAVAGFALWAINKYVPMEPVLKGVLNLLVILAVLYFIIKIFSII